MGFGESPGSRGRAGKGIRNKGMGKIESGAGPTAADEGDLASDAPVSRNPDPGEAAVEALGGVSRLSAQPAHRFRDRADNSPAAAGGDAAYALPLDHGA